MRAQGRTFVVHGGPPLRSHTRASRDTRGGGGDDGDGGGHDAIDEGGLSPMQLGAAFATRCVAEETRAAAAANADGSCATVVDVTGSSTRGSARTKAPPHELKTTISRLVVEWLCRRADGLCVVENASRRVARKPPRRMLDSRSSPVTVVEQTTDRVYETP